MNIGSKIRTFVVLTILATSSGGISAATENDGKPKTKLEEFQRQTGSVLIKGYTEIGSLVAGEPSLSSTSVRAMEFTSATTKKKSTGIVIEITIMSSRVTDSSRSFIDYDEIDDLLKGIDYIAKANADATKHDNFEVKYSTRGDFSATTFNSGNGETKAAIDVGRLSSHLPMDKFAEFRSYIIKAKSKLDALK